MLLKQSKLEEKKKSKEVKTLAALVVDRNTLL